jgi:tetratricopeptide (TPR) repeat protein
MDDDSQLPSQVAVERVCGGRAYREGYVDSRGYFSFEVGRNEAAMMDASSEFSPNDRSGPFGGFGNQSSGPFRDNDVTQRNSLFDCELRASIAGYRSSTINLATHQPLDPPDVGTIVLQRLEKMTGTTISAISMQAPKDAKKAFEKGLDLVKKDKLPDAQREFEKSVSIYPQHAAAWVELGRLLRQEKQMEPAHNAFIKANTIDPNYVNPYLELAFDAAQEQKWKDVLALTDKAISLDPLDFPGSFFFNAVAQYNLGNLPAAEKSARKAARLDSQHRLPRLNLLLGTILADKKDYDGACEQLRSYLKIAPKAPDADAVRTRLTDLEKLGGNNTANAQSQ